MEWQTQPPYSGYHDAEFVVRHSAQCFCGSICFQVNAEPVDAKICHCRQCQTLHGAPFQWAVIFHKHNVRFVRGQRALCFFNPERVESGHSLPCKLSCQICRAPIADEGRRMFLAFGPLFDFGVPAKIPPTFEPTCHIFYGSRVIDIPDGKPKYMGHKGQSSLYREQARL